MNPCDDFVQHSGFPSLELVAGFGFPRLADQSCPLLHTARTERTGDFIVTMLMFAYSEDDLYVKRVKICQESYFLCRSFHTVGLLGLRKESMRQTFSQMTLGEQTNAGQ